MIELLWGKWSSTMEQQTQSNLPAKALIVLCPFCELDENIGGRAPTPLVVCVFVYKSNQIIIMMTWRVFAVNLIVLF
jgi:hypothetical protein